ncbi:Zn-ribbon domain-containing OB-fold protein [Mycobacterium sp. Root265]|uniref:Zn-ribbon domain-containing OB-fold protein n=1 Tax=Mycobacterium sp. Root265 TaxID=1736504 RepID=UPI001F19246B|nr:OB-fold domain-containing protein [Mycobacterium sp. Root265]
MLTHDNAEHYRGRLRRELLVNRCDDCQNWHAPPKPICPRCWSSAITPTAVAGSGTIHLLTLLHQGPPAPGVSYEQPYPVVTVELDEQTGVRFTSTVVDAEANTPAIGARVELVWREVDRAPMPVFVLAEDQQ